MHPWQDDRRRFAAIDEQNRINEEIAEAGRSGGTSRGGVGYLLFLGAVIFFKPLAEYCIEIYGSATAYLHGIAAMFGF